MIATSLKMQLPAFPPNVKDWNVKLFDVVSLLFGGGGATGFFLQSEPASKSIIENRYAKYFVIEICIPSSILFCFDYYTKVPNNLHILLSFYFSQFTVCSSQFAVYYSLFIIFNRSTLNIELPHDNYPLRTKYHELPDLNSVLSIPLTIHYLPRTYCRGQSISAFSCRAAERGQYGFLNNSLPRRTISACP